jgi:hypothetical protein
MAATTRTGEIASDSTFTNDPVSPHDEDAPVIRRMRFENRDKGLPAGTPVPTSEHPIQSFQWGDYTAKPSTAYAYRSA